MSADIQLLKYPSTPTLMALASSRSHCLTGGWRERHYDLFMQWATVQKVPWHALEQKDGVRFLRKIASAGLAADGFSIELLCLLFRGGSRRIRRSCRKRCSSAGIPNSLKCKKKASGKAFAGGFLCPVKNPVRSLDF